VFFCDLFFFFFLYVLKSIHFPLSVVLLPLFLPFFFFADVQKMLCHQVSLLFSSENRTHSLLVHSGLLTLRAQEAAFDSLKLGHHRHYCSQHGTNAVF